MAFYDQLLDNLRAVPGVKSAALAAVSILSGDEWDNSMSVEGHQAQGRRGHAGVHERAVARLLRDDGDPDPRRARLQPHRREGKRDDGDRQPQVRRALLPGPERGRQAHRQRHRPEDQAGHRDRRRRRQRALRRAARRHPPPGLHSELGQGQRDLLRADHRLVVGGVRRDPQRGAEARRVDAGLRDEDARGAARRDADDRSADRVARRRLRPARDAARVDRSLRRDGVRRRAPPQGARHPPRARRRAGRRRSGW